MAVDYNEEKVKDAIHRRTLKYMAAHPDASFQDSLNHVVGQLDGAMDKVVEGYDADRGVCDLYDPKTGRRGKAPCEPTGGKKFAKDDKVKEPVRVGDEVASRVSKYQGEHKTVTYVDALKIVLKEDEALAKVYKTGPGRLFYGDETD